MPSYHRPSSAERVADNPGRRKRSAPACTGPITVRDITRHTAGFGGAGKARLERMIKEANPTDWKYTLSY